MHLPEYFREKYEILKTAINEKLDEFNNIRADMYFYEMCYCLLTPQTKASSAYKVQKRLEELDFKNRNIDVDYLLANPEHYIRFHNQKSDRLHKLKTVFPEVLVLLKNDIPPRTKRDLIADVVNGYGLKESSHFLRNIGYRNVAILDRHILKHLFSCDVIDDIPKNLNKAKYHEIEQKFDDFANYVGISIDELDILFWSYETGEILK